MADDLYAPLNRVLQLAYERASSGKGGVRHGGKGVPFVDQPIMDIQRSHGTPHFALGQIQKKADELVRLENTQARKELLDIMVYAAAAYLFLEEEEKNQPQDFQGMIGPSPKTWTGLVDGVRPMIDTTLVHMPASGVGSTRWDKLEEDDNSEQLSFKSIG